MLATFILLLLFALLAWGIPVGFAMLVTGALGLYFVGGMPAVTGLLGAIPHSSVASYELLIIPMFLLMAEFVLRSGVANDLFDSASKWFGRVPGGLGVATAFAGAGFGAICGSSTAAAATLSSTTLPAMLAHGYEKRMAAGVVAISGTLAMLIPPSIAMVVYGLIADVNIAKLLIAGFIPGVIVALTIALTTVGLALWRPEHAPLSERATLWEKIVSLRLVWPVLILLAAVTGVIYTGIATPTEAAAVGAFFSSVIYIWRRGWNWREMVDILGRAGRTSSMIAVILIGAHTFSTFFALTQTTQGVVSWVSGLQVEPWVIILMLVVLYIILGCFLDQMAILVLTIPLAAPLVASLGYDLIWFGVVVIITAELGMVTPPFGLNCFVVGKYSKVPTKDVFIGVFPHIATHLIAITILLLFPILTLYLPNQM